MYIHKIAVILPLPPFESLRVYNKNKNNVERDREKRKKAILKVPAPIFHFVLLVNLFQCFQMKRKISSEIISLLTLPIHLLLDFIQLFLICFCKWFYLRLRQFLFTSPSSLESECLMKCNLMMASKPIEGSKSPWEVFSFSPSTENSAIANGALEENYANR